MKSANYGEVSMNGDALPPMKIDDEDDKDHDEDGQRDAGEKANFRQEILCVS
jgi:hypothetical protein